MLLPHPVFKSVGSKTQLLTELQARVPESFSRYVEPMVGGGAFYFALARAGDLRGKHSWLTDANHGVINAYRAIVEHCDQVIEGLASLAKRYVEEDPEALYYQMRVAYNGTLGSVHGTIEVGQAIRFIFLRQTAFNGLWRHNRDGQLNMAWGKYKSPRLEQSANIEAAAAHLQTAKLQHIRSLADEVLKECGKGDFVYIDPPYYGMFNKFTAEGMSNDQHIQLLEEIGNATMRGAYVLYSNADQTAITDAVNRVQRSAKIERVMSRAKINRDGAGRGLKSELLVTFPPQVAARRRRRVA